MGTPLERRPALLAAVAMALGVGLGTRGLPLPETAAGALLVLLVARGASWGGAAGALFLLGVALGVVDGPSDPPAPPADWVGVEARPAGRDGTVAWGEARLEGVRVVVDLSARPPPAGTEGLAARGGRVEALGLPLAPGHEPFGTGWRSAGHDAVWRPAAVRWSSAPPPAPLRPPAVREAEWAASSLVWGRHGRAAEPGAEDALRRSGLVHLVVASGLRTTFLFGALALLLSPLSLPAWGRGGIAFAGVLLLSLEVSGLAVARALLMLALLVSARALSRSPDSLNALGMAALVLMSANPRVVGNLSFQLSFAAAATAVLVGKALAEAPAARFAWARAAGAIALAIHLVLTPLLARTTAGAPFWGPMANLVGVPLAMLTGLTAGVHALFGGAPGTGLLDGALARLFMGWAGWVASLPSPEVTVPPAPWSAMVPALVALVLVGWAYRDRRAAAGTALAVLAVGLVGRVPVPTPAVTVLPLSGAVWLPGERALVSRGPPAPGETAVMEGRPVRRIVVPREAVASWREWARRGAPAARVESGGPLRMGAWTLDPAPSAWRLSGPVAVELRSRPGTACPVVLAGLPACLGPRAGGVDLLERGELSAWAGPGGPLLSTYR